MKKIKLFFIAALLCPVFTMHSQDVRIFKTQEYNRNFVENQPNYYQNKMVIEKSYKEFLTNGEVADLNVNLIFHNLYSSNQEMIPQVKIDRQIELLNEHFSSAKYPDPLISKYHEKFEDRFCENTRINFCLVSQQTLDNKGEPFKPVNYRQITRNDWQINNEMKDAISGHPVVLPDMLINVWIVDLEGQSAGFAQAPGGNPDFDGIVIDYKFLKDIDESETTSIYNEGKSFTHLIANYLNVNDLWNEYVSCGDDAVRDTPIHNSPNYRCYTSFHMTTCEKRASIEMLNNFMDATPDACQFYFTNGQMQRMQSVLSKEGFRHGLTEVGCTVHLQDDEGITSRQKGINDKGFKIFPNPSDGRFNIEFFGMESVTSGTILVLDIDGNVMLKKSIKNTKDIIDINLSTKSSNLLYLVKFRTDQGESFINKLIINQ